MNAAAIVCLGFVKAQTGPGGPSEREDMAPDGCVARNRGSREKYMASGYERSREMLS